MPSVHGTIRYGYHGVIRCHRATMVARASNLLKTLLLCLFKVCLLNQLPLARPDLRFGSHAALRGLYARSASLRQGRNHGRSRRRS